MERTLAGLGNRVFLMHNVHEDAPGGLRDPLGDVVPARAADAGADQAADGGAAGGGRPRRRRPPRSGGRRARAGGDSPRPEAGDAASARPVLPPDVPQFFVRPRTPGDDLVYEPKILAIGRIYYADAKAGVATDEEIAVLADPAARVDWDGAAATPVRDADLERVPAEDDAFFGLVPPEAAKGRSYLEWGKAYAEWLYRTRRLELFRSPGTGVVSKPGEAERDFRIRLQTGAREKRDAVVEKVRRQLRARASRASRSASAPPRPPSSARSPSPRSSRCRRRSPSAPRSSAPSSAARPSAPHRSAAPRPPCAAPGA